MRMNVRKKYCCLFLTGLSVFATARGIGDGAEYSRMIDGIAVVIPIEK